MNASTAAVHAGDTESTVSTADRPPAISEDWLAVIVAAAIIGVVLAGVRPALPKFAWTTGADAARMVGVDNLIATGRLAALVLLPIIGGAIALHARLARFVPGVIALYVFGWLAQAAAGNTGVAALGLEYVIFGLVIGLALNRAARLPAWLLEAVKTEYYIKAGLVVLGASILFDEIIGAGLLGIAQALIVVISVWTFTFWLAKRLHVDDEFATMLSSAVSICGVSAAIATCGAIQGDRKKLSYVTSLVLVVAVPMMIVMPWIARATGMPDIMAGAWLGGTLDTSAAVVAGGELLGTAARNAAVVVKLSQNALIGIAAFLLTVWWAVKSKTADRPTVSLAVIWERFPKFVFGFLFVSLLFSFGLSDGTVTGTRGLLTAIRTTLFAMAFVSIGLETSIGSLVSTDEGRPAIAFLGGQAFNIVVTLLAAWLLFGGVLFALPRL